jgi:hypothetical protein
MYAALAVDGKELQAGAFREVLRAVRTRHSPFHRMTDLGHPKMAETAEAELSKNVIAAPVAQLAYGTGVSVLGTNGSVVLSSDEDDPLGVALALASALIYALYVLDHEANAGRPCRHPSRRHATTNRPRVSGAPRRQPTVSDTAHQPR